jgi:hypothetical protein
MKIGRGTAESLFVQYYFGNCEAIGVFFKLRQLAHQWQQIGHIRFHCSPNLHVDLSNRQSGPLNLPKKISLGD